MQKFLYILLFAAFAALPNRAGAEKRSFTLVIDAGHGGHDAGAVGAWSKEKDINLAVSLAFGKLVEDNCPDVKVVYTRRTDVFVPLQRRANIANNCKADLFISIHTNALPAGRIAYGSETYSLGMARAGENLDVAKRENSVITLESDYQRTYQGFDPNKAESYVIFEIMQDRYMRQSVDLARCIQNQYVKAGRPNKGVHQAGFLVLRNTSMPSVLTELGFISTPAEETYLNSQRGVDELSRSIYNGFLAYRRQHDKRADIPAPLPQPPVAEQPATAQMERAEVVPVRVRKPEEPDEKAAAPTKKPESAEKAATDTPRGNAKEAKADNKGAEAAKKQSAGKSQTEKKAKPAAPKVAFRIQVGAGKREIAENDPQFKGLKVTRLKEGGLYKYLHGSFAAYDEAQKALAAVREKLPSAYIVAYKDGAPVPVAEARAARKK